MLDAQPLEGNLAPWTEWPTVQARVNRMWDPENNPHHSIIGLTGSGKSYLAVNGLLKPMCPYDRVMIFDSKGDDPLVSSLGKEITALPHAKWKVSGKRTMFDQWYRINVPGEPEKREHARNMVRTALSQMYAEGNWVIFFDEIRDITDPRAPGLGLLPQVDVIYRKGRSRRVSLVACTQAPRYVPTSFYDQASFAWIGRIRDELRQKRLLEVGGLSKRELPLVANLERRQWLLSADNGEFFARTSVTS